MKIIYLIAQIVLYSALCGFVFYTSLKAISHTGPDDRDCETRYNVTDESLTK